MFDIVCDSCVIETVLHVWTDKLTTYRCLHARSVILEKMVLFSVRFTHFHNDMGVFCPRDIIVQSALSLCMLSVSAAAEIVFAEASYLL